MTGAPHLARFSRDVGYHCSFPLTLDSSDALSGQHLWGTRHLLGNIDLLLGSASDLTDADEAEL
jgi:hypothetical protein